MVTNRTLVNVTGNHSKFYVIRVVARVVKVTWGRIGSWEQSKVHTFGNLAAAQAFAFRKMNEKLNHGYVAVS